MREGRGRREVGDAIAERERVGKWNKDEECVSGGERR